ncbi:MAG TPA: aminopeptidase, partial [Trueperaceae bacterium]
MPLAFEDKLANYADLIVNVGVALQAGQRLVVYAPIEGAPLVRRVAAAAYRAGAPLVEVVWNDDALTVTRLELAPADSLDTVASWKVTARRGAVERGDALVTLSGRDPDLFRGQDPGRVAVMQRALRAAYREVSEEIMQNAIAWCVAAVPVPGWADKVFADQPEAERLACLWDAVFTATRANLAEPVAAWRQHLRALAARQDTLNQRRYQALVFRGPGTDLTVGLP